MYALIVSQTKPQTELKNTTQIIKTNLPTFAPPTFLCEYANTVTHLVSTAWIQCSVEPQPFLSLPGIEATLLVCSAHSPVIIPTVKRIGEYLYRLFIAYCSHCTEFSAHSPVIVPNVQRIVVTDCSAHSPVTIPTVQRMAQSLNDCSAHCPVTYRMLAHSPVTDCSANGPVTYRLFSA